MVKMNKILSFIINEKKELLLLKGSPSDPQFKKSLWYVVTGGCENIDKTKVDTVKREIKEETNLDSQKILYLNWIFKYMSLGHICIEYVFITSVNNETIILNEENLDYEWCNIDKFIEKIDWFGDKNILKLVLTKALNGELYFKSEQIDEIF
jgi:8-oxo-dGTP pyrophosphatase MutT (NUDIX family)